MKTLLMLLTFIVSTSAMASSEIRSSSGATCEQSDFQPWEVSFGGGQDNRNYSDYDSYDRTHTEDKGKYVGAQIKYSFGGAKQIDCSRFQSIVEREQEARTKQLEMKIQELENQLEKQTRIMHLASKVQFK